MSDDTFTRAKRLLYDAMETVIAAAAHEGSKEQADVPCTTQSVHQSTPPSAPRGRQSSSSWLSKPGPSSQVTRTPLSSDVALKEHRRIFGYQPSKSNKGKGALRNRRKTKAKNAMWKKDCICLSNSEQTWRPSPEEKISLAGMGLGLRSGVVFNKDGDHQHIHDVIMREFPMLDCCGGYTLLRLAENSHSMVEIEGPDCGMSVSYLKDILNQAKLYVRPLQKDLTEEDMEPYSINKVIREWSKCLPTGLISKHTE